MGVKKLLNFGGLRNAIKYVFVASKGDVLSESKEDGGETMAELVQPLGSFKSIGFIYLEGTVRNSVNSVANYHSFKKD